MCKIFICLIITSLGIYFFFPSHPLRSRTAKYKQIYAPAVTISIIRIVVNSILLPHYIFRRHNVDDQGRQFLWRPLQRFVIRRLLISNAIYFLHFT